MSATSHHRSLTRRTEFAIDPRVAQWAVQGVGRLLATFAVLQGLSILIGGRARWSGRSYAAALSVPGAPDSWGWMLLGLGALALGCSLLGRVRLTGAGLIAIGIWCGFFAISFFITAIRDDHASVGGVWSYGFLACLSWVMGVIYWTSRES